MRMNLPPLPLPTTPQKEEAQKWFETLQQTICTGLEALEQEFKPNSPPPLFRRKQWDRNGGGGGCMALLEGNLFEKAGVNASTVFGTFSPSFAAQIQGCQEDPSFWASGLSLVIHPRSPHVPIIHMNTRHMVTTQAWCGGGIDLTPSIPQTEDTTFFHTTLKTACDAHDETFYPRFKAQADTYFFLPHRNEPRGVGGIFYDSLTMDSWDHAMAFTRAIGEIFLPLYSKLVRRRWRDPWGEKEYNLQLKKRARYVEFNLIYDRGTLFGLKTNGFIEAIFMSLPPLAAWPNPFDEM